MSKSQVKTNLLESLAAVLVGNGIYFLVQPVLPGVARHEMFRQDFGLLIDFVICFAVLGLIRRVRRRSSNPG